MNVEAAIEFGAKGYTALIQAAYWGLVLLKGAGTGESPGLLAQKFPPVATQEEQ